MRRSRGWPLVLAAVGALHGGCVCLDLTTPRRYQCTADQQCIGGWRCGTDGFCVDPSGDSLRANAAAPAPAVARISPVEQGLPDLVASTQDSVGFPGTCADAGGHSNWYAEPAVAELRGDEVAVTAVWPDGRESLPDGGLPTGPDCATLTAISVSQDRFVGSLGGRRALDATMVGGVTYVLTDLGGLCAFRFAPGTPGLAGGCRTGVFSFGPTQLRSSPGDRYFMVAFNPNNYALYNLLDGGVSATGSVTTSGGRPQVISDLLIGGSSGGYELLTAATDGGLFVSSLGGYRFENDGGAAPPFGFWEPVETQEVSCAREPYPSQYSAPLALRLAYDSQNRVSNDPLLAVHVRRDTGYVGGTFIPEDHALLYRATDDAGSPWYGRCVPVPTPSSAPSYRPLFYSEAFRDCTPCDDEHWLRDFRLGWEYSDLPPYGSTLVMEARCIRRDGDAGETTNVIPDVMANCYANATPLPDLARYARPTRWQRSDGYGQAMATDLGGVYASSFNAGLVLPGVVMDVAPAAVVQTANGLTASTVPQFLGDQFSQSRQRLLPRLTYHEGANGYGGTGNDFFPWFAGIAGQPTWAISGNEDQNLFLVAENILQPRGAEHLPLRILARFTDAVKFGPPFLGAAVRNAAGQSVLMVASNDALTATDVSALVNDPDAGGFDEPSYFGAPSLEIRAVPLPRTPITSMVGLPPEPDAGTALFAEAFILQGGKVFHVAAPNATLWHVDELDLGGADVVAVVADGRRGRAGARDGTVFALPSRVPLSGPLAGAPVLDYAQAGATTFAVAGGGLFRLVADGSSPLGTWEAVPVAPLPPDGRGYAGARLFSVADQLILFLQGGWGYKVSGGR